MNSSKQNARASRLARDAERERVRAALRFGADYGYYVFDELATEDKGTLDYLAVGALGVCAIIIRDDEGIFIADPYNHEWYLNGYPFEDDPKQQKIELTDDVSTRLFNQLSTDRLPDATSVPVDHVICLTRAEIHGSGNDEAYRGITDLWTLPLVLFAQGDEHFTPADVEEAARAVERAYGRPPFVRPHQPYGGSTI